MEIVRNTINFFLIKIINFYQFFISPILQNNYSFCKFYPSCSNYMILAIKKYGSGQGIWFGLLRLIKCHPFFVKNKFIIDWP